MNCKLCEDMGSVLVSRANNDGGVINDEITEECPCQLQKKAMVKLDAEKEQKLRNYASKGYKWAAWKLMRDYNESGDGLIPEDITKGPR